MERRNAWKVYDQTELEKLDKINETYKNCLDDGKTERECITLAVKKAEAAGYKNLKELQKEHVKLKAGDKCMQCAWIRVLSCSSSVRSRWKME